MKKKNTATIFTRICFPLFLVMFIQFGIFYAVTIHGRVVSTLNNNSVDIFSERVNNRRNEIESKFTSQWANTTFYSNALNDLYNTYDRKYSTPLYSDKEQQRSFLADASSTLFNMIRNNSVNGVFLILSDSDYYKACTEEEQSYYGLCIRDYDLYSGYTAKEDLMIERSPSSLTSQLGCPLDAYWDAFYTFSKNGKTGEFYYEPIRVAYGNPGIAADNFAYFSEPHQYADSDRSVVSYSVPLIASNGDIYGVLGVELTEDYLSTLLPQDELQEQNNGAYMLVQYEEGTTDYRVVASSGVLFQRAFGDTRNFQLEQSEAVKNYENTFHYTGQNKLKVCANIVPLEIYNPNTPFEKHIFALVGVVNEDSLFSISKEIQASLLWVSLITFSLGFLGIFVVSHRLSRPIRTLARKVQKMGPDSNGKLEHIYIREIDQLVDAIENQGQLINQSKVRTEFFSRMSHDMRTPMNAIIGFSSSEIVDGSSQEQLLEYLGKINGSGRYLLGLINEVLDMTKIDSGRMELESSEFQIRELWNGIVPMIDELAVQKNVRFEKEIFCDSEITVVGDRQRLSQVIVNLLSNAVKFTPENGTVCLKIEQKELLTKELKLLISVSDTGIGMSKEFMSRIYEPFSQEHPNREGTGLGLSIANQLVTLMGGTIQCNSELGQGTTFIVDLTLPVSETVQRQEQNRVYTEEELKRILSGKRILLCEDHPLNRQIACGLLNRQGIEVETAENGRIGVEMFSQSVPGYYNAVLMDIRMPVMDGIEATKYIRALDRKDARTIPILAMTANAFQDDMDATAAAGMNEHLSKPIEPQKLYQALVHHMG